MELSIFLAKIIGLTLLFLSLALLANKKNISLLFTLYKNPKAVLLTGFFETFVGLSLVLIHNVWELNFRVVITVIGWLLLIRGVGRVFAPEKTVQMVKKYQKMPQLMTGLLILVFFVGMYLTFMGFTK